MSEREPLPSEGPERRIFLVALQRFSEQCYAPYLIEDCPFSVDLDDGTRGCAEECKDLLSRFGRPIASTDTVFTQSGLVAHRRPSTRPPAHHRSGGRAFDAGQAYHSALGPTETWGAVPLLYAVRAIAQTAPAARAVGDNEELQKCLRTLFERGFDVDAISVRQSLNKGRSCYCYHPYFWSCSRELAPKCGNLRPD